MPLNDHGDPTLGFILAHSVKLTDGSSLTVTAVSKALEKTKTIALDLCDGVEKLLANPDITYAGKSKGSASRANNALVAIEAATNDALKEARAEIETLRGAISPATVLARTLNSDGQNALSVLRREMRAREIRLAILGLDAGGREVALLRLVETLGKVSALDALAAVIDTPLEPFLEAKRLDGVVHRWFEIHEPKRLAAITELESALMLLETAVERGFEYAKAFISGAPLVEPAEQPLAPV